jgi:hypothetical protein
MFSTLQIASRASAGFARTGAMDADANLVHGLKMGEIKD